MVRAASLNLGGIAELASLQTGDEELLRVNLDEIDDDPQNVRDTYHDIEGLAQAIEAVGLESPPSVSRQPNGRFMLRAGHRRVRAMRLLKWTSTLVLVKPLATAGRTVQLVENIQRADLSALEVARALRTILSENPTWTQKQLAGKIGRPQSYVSEHLAVLTLPPDVQALAEKGLVTFPRRLSSIGAMSPPDRVAIIEALEGGSSFEEAMRSPATPAGEAKSKPGTKKAKVDADENLVILARELGQLAGLGEPVVKVGPKGLAITWVVVPDQLEKAVALARRRPKT